MIGGLIANARLEKAVRRSGRPVDRWRRDRRYFANQLVVCTDLRGAIELKGSATSVSAEMPGQVLAFPSSDWKPSIVVKESEVFPDHR
jgi:hypothetical protein